VDALLPAHVIYFLGRIAFEQGRVDQAAAHFGRAINLGPPIAKVYFHLGMVNLSKEQENEAEAAFREAIHIDAQMEGALHFLATEFADEEINGRTAGRNGNADRHMCPHGVYAAAGDDCWVAIACETDEHWGALANLVDADADLRDLDMAARRAHAETIDAAITAWTEPREAADIEAALQACGVPAHRVSDAADLMADPQIVAREHFLSVPHAKHGHTWVETSNFELSRTPGRPLWGGPMFGEHNMEVLEGILGYDADRVAELVIAGALT